MQDANLLTPLPPSSSSCFFFPGYVNYSRHIPKKKKKEEEEARVNVLVLK